MRDREVFSILSTTYLNELMAYPSIDAEHIDPPYLPDKPINIMSRGDYHVKDLDIMIGNFLKVKVINENNYYNKRDIKTK